MKKKLLNALAYFIPSRKKRAAFRLKILTQYENINYAISNEMRFEVCSNCFWGNFNSGHWEIETREFYKKYVSPLKEVIDIGGWIGPTMLLAYSFNPKKISVVEADPANYQILKTNCLKNYLNDKVDLHCVCISNNTDEILTFGYTDENKQDTSTKGIGGQRVKVRTISLLDFLKTKNLNETNIIKIDIEGGEQFIEEGLDYISNFCGINVLLSIHTPFWDNKQKTADSLLKEFKKFDILSDKEKVIGIDEIKTMMLAGGVCGWENKTGTFFTLILKTKNQKVIS